MRRARLLRSGLSAMRRFKLRTFAMAVGSFVGVTALCLVVSVGRGVERKVLATVRQIFGESSVLVMAGGSNLMSGPRAGAARLTLDDVEVVAREVSEVVAWDAQQVANGASVKRGDAVATTRVVGQTERAPGVWDRGVSRGEFFDASAIASSARVAVIGETVARDLFGEEDPIGAEIQIGAAPFRVVGVLEAFGTDVHGMDRDDEVVIPLSTAMRRVLNVDTILLSKLLVRRPEDAAPAAKAIKRVLRGRHGLGVDQPDDFTSVTSLQVRKMVATVRRVLFVFLPLVAGVSLLAGGALSAALMLSSVGARVREIGLRRAVGARTEDIRAQFLVETTGAAVAGGTLGVVAGETLAWLAAGRFHLDGVVSWPAALLGVSVAAAVGLLAGVLPARRAAAMDPAVALR